jgi:hypothetical protein
MLYIGVVKDSHGRLLHYYIGQQAVILTALPPIDTAFPIHLPILFLMFSPTKFISAIAAL